MNLLDTSWANIGCEFYNSMIILSPFPFLTWLKEAEDLLQEDFTAYYPFHQGRYIAWRGAFS